MQHKPIKRNENLIRLSKDHHFILLFCWKIRTGLKFEVNNDRIKNYVLYFWQDHLQPHFRLEEQLLFALVNDSAVQKATDDHTQIARQINIITAHSEFNTGDLATLSDMVYDHIRYEERKLFPHLETFLPAEKLKSIGKILDTHQPWMLKDNFKDEFWVKQKQDKNKT